MIAATKSIQLWRTTEFGDKANQCFGEQATFIHVFDQRCKRSISARGVAAGATTPFQLLAS